MMRSQRACWTGDLKLGRRSALSRVEPACPDERGGGCARVDSELGVDVVEVLPDGPTRYPKPFGDLGVRPALSNEIQDLAFARREPRHVLLLLEKQRAVNKLNDERSV